MQSLYFFYTVSIERVLKRADSNDSTDRRFRQSGLEDNQGKFQGVTSFKYYGELVDPELSNLLIFTGGIGIRPSRKSSIDLVFHEYVQDQFSTKLKGWEIDAKSAGLSRRLGREIDLITGYRDIRDLDIKLILGYFIPDDAFPQNAQQHSFLVNAEIRWSFYRISILHAQCLVTCTSLCAEKIRHFHELLENIRSFKLVL